MVTGPGLWPLVDLSAWLGKQLIQHDAFTSTLSDLQQALAGNPIVLLTGVAGTGKSTLASRVVKDTNEGCSSGQVRAVMVVAPAPHRRAFSWKDLWTEILMKLGDPMPDRKLDREAAAARLANGRGIGNLRGTEGSLQRAVRDAVTDLGVVLLVIDDAGSLLKNESGRAFRDQLDVLRNLASVVGCRILLVATPSILKKLNLSPELDRRMDEVVLERYQLSLGGEDDDMEAFRRVVVTIRDRLRMQGRWDLRLTNRRVRLLHEGCLGCVGTLIEWFGRALLEAGESELRWEHLQATVLADEKREGAKQTFKTDEQRCAKALSRSLGSGSHTPEEDESSEPAPAPTDTKAPPGRAQGGSVTRPGMPKPTRHQAVKTLAS